MKPVTVQWPALIVASAIGLWLAPPAAGGVATFDDLALSPGSYWNGSDGSGGFNTGGLQFSNTYDQTFGSWEGWAYSNMTDTLTAGYGNQYSAIAGGGYSGSSNYGVAYDGFSHPGVTFPAPAAVQGACFTNTTYAYLSMLNGDSFAKKFGGTSGNDPDWFRLLITGKDGAGQVTGIKDLYLADFRFADNTQDYITKNWVWLDLTGLGNNVRSLEFSLSSSDVGPFGMNTPAYFAMDNLTVVPEPAFLCLLLSAAGALALGLLCPSLASRFRAWRPANVNARLAVRPTLLLALLPGIWHALPASAGPYAPAAGQPGSTAIFKDDPGFVQWATGVTVVRGLQEIDNPSLGYASFGTPAMALGRAEGTATDCVSLGDGGWATLSFAYPIPNGLGPDFAVFENSFSDTFLELGFVEVSSDGANFFRFPAVSLTPTDTQVGSFGTLDPTNINNLAGKYRAGYGTPFDLQELAGVSPLLNIDAVTHVRVVDVVGSVQDPYATYDSQNHKVNDPWPTPFDSGGFDLDAVGVLHTLPEPLAWVLALSGAAVMWWWGRRASRASRRQQRPAAGPSSPSSAPAS